MFLFALFSATAAVSGTLWKKKIEKKKRVVFVLVGRQLRNKKKNQSTHKDG
jgi:hypothetical protein